MRLQPLLASRMSGLGRWLTLAAAAVLISTSGCRAFTSNPQPRQPRVISEFMDQPRLGFEDEPRPGAGILGP